MGLFTSMTCLDLSLFLSFERSNADTMFNSHREVIVPPLYLSGEG